MSKNTVIFSAPKGWGKTAKADSLQFIFQCEGVIHNWLPQNTVRVGYLHLTNQSIPIDTQKTLRQRYGVKIIEIQHESKQPLDADPHQPGVKLDTDKNRIGLVMEGFPRALAAIGHVAIYGAAKYTDHGWRIVPNGRARYTDAMYRHLLAEASGHVQDDESGLQHAAHAAWNALARLELMLSAQPATHQEPQP